VCVCVCSEYVYHVCVSYSTIVYLFVYVNVVCCMCDHFLTQTRTHSRHSRHTHISTRPTVCAPKPPAVACLCVCVHMYLCVLRRSVVRSTYLVSSSVLVSCLYNIYVCVNAPHYTTSLDAQPSLLPMYTHTHTNTHIPIHTLRPHTRSYQSTMLSLARWSRAFSSGTHSDDGVCF